MKLGNKDSALFVAGVIFALVAFAHFVRIFTHFNLLIARQMIPIWPSYIGFGVFFVLSLWMFYVRSGERKGKAKR